MPLEHVNASCEILRLEGRFLFVRRISLEDKWWDRVAEECKNDGITSPIVPVRTGRRDTLLDEAVIGVGEHEADENLVGRLFLHVSTNRFSEQRVRRYKFNN